MYRWLAAHNIKTTDVEIVQLDASALSQAFAQGNIDAMFAWEPYNYNASSKIPTLSESWTTELYSGRHTVVMNTDYLQKNSIVAERVIRGFIKAEEYIKNYPEDAKKVVMEKTGMSDVALNKLWGEYIYKVQLDDKFLNIINDESSWIKSSTGKSSTVDVTKLVNPTYLRNVNSSLVGGAFKS